ncbi:hypothetical protein CRE_08024 [Caenorhabditis remanei]|uniref:F-box domain-containing protein n=1 Tax=Caenorhabditis remanei TaxID=31234 RepID=E3M3V5_CAERE|nr:hypothetical protein CRE_08024 [Caenorhabditis remanei]
MKPLKLYNWPYVIQKEILGFMDLQSIFLLSLCSKRMNSLIVSVERARFKKIQYIHCHIEDSITINAFMFDGSSDLIIQLLYPIAVKCSGTLTISGFDVHYGLPKLRNVTSSNIFVYPTIDGKTVDDFCSASPHMEFLRIGENIRSRLEENSNIYRIKTLDIEENNSEIVPGILHKFTGRQAFMWTSKVDNSDIIHFLNRWKSNAAFQNLEVLTIHLRNVSDPTDPIEIRNSVGVKELNTDNNGHEYHYKRRINSKPDVLSLKKFNAFSYLVREYDNRVASVVIEKNMFLFGVWDLTEDEFLEKFSKGK